MNEGHPLGWFLLTGAVCGLALTTTNLWLLGALVVGIILASVVAGGPRSASMTMALGWSLLLPLTWVALTLLAPTPHTSPVIIDVPHHAVGPGAGLGGPVTLGSAALGLARALRAVVVVAALGLAGQVVSARGWAALSTAAMGPAGPMLGWCATLGEASSAALRRGSSSWLTTWLTTAARISEALFATHRRPAPWASALRVGLVLASGFLVLVPLLFTRALATARIDGALLTLTAATVVCVVGMALPGCPRMLRRWRWDDVLPLAAAGVFIAVWLSAPRAVLVPTDVLDPALPWWLIPAALVLPAAVIMGSITVRREVARV